MIYTHTQTSICTNRKLLFTIGHHDDCAAVLLPNHSPEVPKSILQGSCEQQTTTMDHSIINNGTLNSLPPYAAGQYLGWQCIHVISCIPIETEQAYTHNHSYNTQHTVHVISIHVFVPKQPYMYTLYCICNYNCTLYNVYCELVMKYLNEHLSNRHL